MFKAFERVNKWFKVNSLSINVEKTHYVYIQFKTKKITTSSVYDCTVEDVE